MGKDASKTDAGWRKIIVLFMRVNDSRVKTSTPWVRAFKDGGRIVGTVGWLQVVDRKKYLKFIPVFRVLLGGGGGWGIVIHKAEK
jgi:hypothetical protein